MFTDCVPKRIMKILTIKLDETTIMHYVGPKGTQLTPILYKININP